MTNSEKTIITVKTLVIAPVEKVWSLWSDPEHIVQWNTASDDWHTTRAENDLRVGGKFLSRMEAKDVSFGFDFSGQYTKVELNRQIDYTLGDERKVQISFATQENGTLVTETFEAENENPVELQQTGWQAIMDNFKKYTEGMNKLETLHFEISIDTPVENVYRVMLDKKHYEEWTAAFNPTSRYEGSWEKGAKIFFLGTDENGSSGGMVGQIKANIPNQYVSIEYTGVIQGDREITSGPEIEGWAGSCENYTFKATDKKTLLSIDLDTNYQFLDYFKDTYPKALDILKSICEK